MGYVEWENPVLHVDLRVSVYFSARMIFLFFLVVSNGVN